MIFRCTRNIKFTAKLLKCRFILADIPLFSCGIKRKPVFRTNPHHILQVEFRWSAKYAVHTFFFNKLCDTLEIHCAKVDSLVCRFFGAICLLDICNNSVYAHALRLAYNLKARSTAKYQQLFPSNIVVLSLIVSHVGHAFFSRLSFPLICIEILSQQNCFQSPEEYFYIQNERYMIRVIAVELLFLCLIDGVSI